MAPCPPYLREQAGMVYLSLKVQPRASRNEVGEAAGAELKVKVTAPPVDSAANEAVVRFIAEVIGCPRSSVHLVRGATSRHKVLALSGVDVSAVAARLH